MENNEKKYDELLESESLNKSQKELENDKTNDDKKTETEQIELDNDVDDNFGFVEDNSNDVIEERCNESDIVVDDDNQNYKFFDKNDTSPVNELSDEKWSWLEDIMNSNINTDSENAKKIDNFNKNKEKSQFDNEQNVSKHDNSEHTNEERHDEYVEENTDIEKDQVRTPDPVVIGHPIPTDLLNPELAAKEQERKNNQDKSEDFDIPTGLFGEPDYTELFNSYNEIIETLDNNINYVIHRIQAANRKIWISYGIAIVAIIIAILK